MVSLAYYRHRHLALLGLGKAHYALYTALRASGAYIDCWDDDENVRRALDESGDAITLVDLWEQDFSRYEGLIVSPGIAHRGASAHPLAHKARACGCPIMGELSCFDHVASADTTIIAITGTNGKTTTTALLTHMLQQTHEHAYERVHMAGNIGTPLFSLEEIEGVCVFELSSFQLDFPRTRAFEVAVLLNIARDHLAHHGGMDAYYQAKESIFQGGGRNAHAFIGVDDAKSLALFKTLRASSQRHVVGVSESSHVEGGLFIENGYGIDDRHGKRTRLFSIKERQDIHPLNQLVAFGVADVMGVEQTACMRALRSFVAPSHRCAHVGQTEMITFVNDSKATNIHACLHALSRYDNIFWIAGGSSKGEEEHALKDLEESLTSVCHAFFIGEMARAMARSVERYVPVTCCDNLRSAFSKACEHAQEHASSGKRSTVLLSPACASFDQFRDYRHRGACFTAYVEEWLTARTSMETAP
ncbi:MAG: UDP-N-acetylmuramoyl-L-alanine--D-glutamate ligase [Alphaproteobacteria bacterium GM7ARS4]|nr:UDP-N-acetylmuramoyl-L-alanine--D-glutamate ligase [Alphaproteobacteria bacterium GM7ARS4]